jgi:hypothetical protein
VPPTGARWSSRGTSPNVASCSSGSTSPDEQPRRAGLAWHDPRRPDLSGRAQAAGAAPTWTNGQTHRDRECFELGELVRMLRNGVHTYTSYSPMSARSGTRKPHTVGRPSRRRTPGGCSGRPGSARPDPRRRRSCRPATRGGPVERGRLGPEGSPAAARAPLCSRQERLAHSSRCARERRRLLCGW